VRLVGFIIKRFAYILGKFHFISIFTTTITKLVHSLHLISPATFITLFYHVKVNFYFFIRTFIFYKCRKPLCSGSFPRIPTDFLNFSKKILPSLGFVFLRKINSYFNLHGENKRFQEASNFHLKKIVLHTGFKITSLREKKMAKKYFEN
jgi:hypothetical protein